MNVYVLTASLGNFDRIEQPIEQSMPFGWWCFKDEDFPPIAGLSPRLQYRIPKTQGWQIKPGADVYIWLDGSMKFARRDSLEWLVGQLGDGDMAIFKHPDRKTIREEVEYLEAKKDHPYIKARYENGLHKEQLAEVDATAYSDDRLWASTLFAYRPNGAVRAMMKDWLYTSVRYFTCDQVALPYLAWCHGVDVREIDLNPFKNEYFNVGRHNK